MVDTAATANGTGEWRLAGREARRRARGGAEVGEWEVEPAIWKLYFRPDRRGQGIVRQLLRAALAELPRRASRVILEHFAGSERAAAFSQSEGFVHLRTDPAASGDPAAATVWRVLDLTSM